MREFVDADKSLSFQFRSDCQPYTVILAKGKYQFESWGASGGSD